MKKIIAFAALLLGSYSLEAQTFPNAGMETWRTRTSGTSPSITVKAPNSWYGFDSLIIALGQSFGSLIGAGSDWNAQVSQESTFIHGGSSAAKLMTRKQDTLGFFPGLLSDASVSVNVFAIIGGADPMSAISFNGGTPVTYKVTSVSAWVAYSPGIDTATGMMGGDDSGAVTVQAIADIGGVDSVVGVGFASVAPSSTYYQVTANVNYTVDDVPITKVRVIFASSGANALDSSTMYVDDVSMTGVTNPVVVNSVFKEDIVVTPNPANNQIIISGLLEKASIKFTDLSGRAVMTKDVPQNGLLTIADLPIGSYFYQVLDSAGFKTKSGKLTVIR